MARRSKFAVPVTLLHVSKAWVRSGPLSLRVRVVTAKHEQIANLIMNERNVASDKRIRSGASPSREPEDHMSGDGNPVG